VRLGHYSVPDTGAEYCGDRVCLCVCVCASVCVFVCLRAYLCKYTSDLYKIFVHDAYGSDSVLLWHGVAIRYVLPVLWMTSYLRISQGSSEWLPT